MEGLIFLIIVAYLFVDTLRTAWHIWSAEFVDAEVIGFKLSKWCENKVVLSFTSSEGGKQQLEMPFSLVPKPEGHQIKIWVKKGRKNYKYFLLFSLFFTLGIICWSVLFLLIFLPDDIGLSKFSGLMMILFYSGPFLALLGLFIQFKLLNRLPQIFFPKPTKKLSKGDYEALEKKAGLLSYEDMVNMRYYGLTRISTKLIAICGLIFFSYFIYSNWVDFQNSR